MMWYLQSRDHVRDWFRIDRVIDLKGVNFGDKEQPLVMLVIDDIKFDFEFEVSEDKRMIASTSLVYYPATLGLTSNFSLLYQ